MAYTRVDTPVRLGNLEIKNRVFRPAHGSGIGWGMMNDALIAYHEERARGGAGLIISEVGSVHPTTALTLNIFDHAIEGGMRKLVDRLKPHGTALFQQLWHAGHIAMPTDGSQPWSSSDVPHVEVGLVPNPMTKMMIDEIIGAFAECAHRMEEYGLDGVDVHCAHGYLPAQFLSPAINKREDEYGGSLENRMRFIIEMMTAIRGAVSPNFVVGVRLGADLAIGGSGIEDNLRVAQALESAGLIDYLNVSVGNYAKNDQMIGGMNEPVGYQLPNSLPIAQGSHLPVLATGRFRTLEEMDQVIRDGQADMVGAVRAMIAEPRLVEKSLSGQAVRARPCIACNQSCVANQVVGLPIECAVNAGAGHELERGDHLLQPVGDARNILVVGGGPAGMEAARVAAIRGHRVTLVEASAHLGGSMRAAAKAPTRHQMIDIVTWLEAEIFRLGVNVRLSTYFDADDVMAENPDAVIFATGATERMDGIQMSLPGRPIVGVDRRGVISSTELFMQTPATLGNTAVVVDDVGHFEGLGAVEFLINRGLAVTYVTPKREIAPLVRGTLMIDPFIRRMVGKPFRHMIRTCVLAIEEGNVVVGPVNLMDPADRPTIVPADTVVLISSNRPNREAYDALRDRLADLHIVGDAHSPRFLQAAIREGHIAGASVGLSG